MDDGKYRLSAISAEGAGRSQQMSPVYAVMVCLAMIILLQTLLLNIAVEGYLGGVIKVILPATAASGLCFAGTCWLTACIHRTGKSTG